MSPSAAPDPDQPSGTVTLVFTDIEGSTRLLQALGDRYPEVLAEHHRLIRDAFAGPRRERARLGRRRALLRLPGCPRRGPGRDRRPARGGRPDVARRRGGPRSDGHPHRRADPGRRGLRRPRRPSGGADLRGRPRRPDPRVAGHPGPDRLGAPAAARPDRPRCAPPPLARRSAAAALPGDGAGPGRRLPAAADHRGARATTSSSRSRASSAASARSPRRARCSIGRSS